MANISTKIKLYLEANGKDYSELKLAKENSFVLQDDWISGVSNPYIREWKVSGLAQPTAEQLASYDSSGDTAEANQTVRFTRRNAYGNIGDQLDEIFKDIDAWKARIQAIKDNNPKS